MKKHTIKIKNKRYELVFSGIDQWPPIPDDEDYAGYINVDIRVGDESFGVSGGWIDARSGDFTHYQTKEEGGINCHKQLNKFAKAINYKLDKEELESQWWNWHDSDSTSWYDSFEAAEKACKSWVSGKSESEIGPDHNSLDFSSLGELIADQATPIIEKYIDENCPAILELQSYKRNNKGCYMCLNRGNDGYHLYIWDKKKDSVNDDGQKASDGGFISCTTSREMNLLSEYETSGDVVKI